jgi:hypothetical protein
MRSRFCGLLLIGAAATSTAATCPPQPRTAAGVLATENAWVAALEHRDAAALDCILDPGFTDNNWRGEQVPRDAVLAHLAERPSSELELSEMKVTLNGATAVVRGVNTQTGKITASVRFTDVFVYRHHRWRAIVAQETLVRPGP